jgi:hypothetical protein
MPAQNRVFGQRQKLTSNADVRRRAVEAAPGSAMPIATVMIALVIFC